MSREATELVEEDLNEEEIRENFRTLFLNTNQDNIRSKEESSLNPKHNGFQTPPRKKRYKNVVSIDTRCCNSLSLPHSPSSPFKRFPSAVPIQIPCTNNPTEQAFFSSVSFPNESNAEDSSESELYSPSCSISTNRTNRDSDSFESKLPLPLMDPVLQNSKESFI